ncbi:unnamed protein product [Lasius platythorax]|uniref:Uncharacterized protein n=1 Tax=Lasius platythorax TaxID=488582 RepID=A0AAV2P2M8_9HYME
MQLQRPRPERRLPAEAAVMRRAPCPARIFVEDTEMQHARLHVAATVALLSVDEPRERCEIARYYPLVMEVIGSLCTKRGILKVSALWNL